MTQARTVSDAAKRVSDQYNLHRSAAPHDGIGKWFSAALHDGTSDGVLYDTKRDAVRHTKHDEDFYAFIQVGPWTMTPMDAEIFLDKNRRLYDKGMRMADPDDMNGGREVIRRVTREDELNSTRVPSNLIIPGS